MDNSKSVNFLDAKRKLLLNEDVSQATIVRTQEVHDSHLDWLRDERIASANAPAGDFHLAASIPVAVVEKWFAEGFNIFDKNNTLEDIMKRLRREDMEKFIGTSKQLF